MSDNALTQQAVDENSEKEQLARLKTKAGLLGITYSNNISVAALREKINAKMNDEVFVEPTKQENALVPVVKSAKTPSLRTYMQTEQMKLVRLRITNLDPKKKDLPGEIITVANKYLGTVRKYVPYGEVTDNGYHVPYCIYMYLKNRKFLNVRVRKGSGGKEIVESSFAQEFSLDVLPQLTKDELAKLAAAQAAAAGT